MITTENFVNTLKGWGCTVAYFPKYVFDADRLVIITDFGYPIATVHIFDEFSVHTNKNFSGLGFSKERLYRLFVDYAETPISERKNEEWLEKNGFKISEKELKYRRLKYFEC